jgi:hypothetical protein
MIFGFYFKKISVEKKEPMKGQVKINTKTNIQNIEKHDMKTENKQALKFDFDFSILYDPKFAEINIEGHVLYLAEPKEAKEILDSWKKKEIPEQVRLQVLNTIMNKCNIKALSLEEDMGLPPHIPLPKFQAKSEGKTGSYTG